VRRFRVLLDAGVLVDAQVRDVFLGLAEAEMIDLRWSEGLLDELRSLLVDDMGRDVEPAQRLCDAIRGAYPFGEVISSDEALAARLAGDDPDGLHPLVAAVTAEADVLVSHDRNRFPPDEALAHWNLSVLSPDDALAEMVDALGAERVASVFDDLTDLLGLTPEQLLDQLHHLGQVAPVAAIAIGAEIDAGEGDVLRDYLVGSRPGNARATVSQLVNRVGDGDLSGMDTLLSPVARRKLGSTARVRHRRLQDAFLDMLVAPGDWAFSAGSGAARSGAEVVELAPLGDDVDDPFGPVAPDDGASPAARDPRTVTFAVVATGDHWHIDDVVLPEPPG